MCNELAYVLFCNYFFIELVENSPPFMGKEDYSPSSHKLLLDLILIYMNPLHTHVSISLQFSLISFPIYAQIFEMFFSSSDFHIILNTKISSLSCSTISSLMLTPFCVRQIQNGLVHYTIILCIIKILKFTYYEQSCFYVLAVSRYWRRSLKGRQLTMNVPIVVLGERHLYVAGRPELLRIVAANILAFTG